MLITIIAVKLLIIYLGFTIPKDQNQIISNSEFKTTSPCGQNNLPTILYPEQQATTQPTNFDYWSGVFVTAFVAFFLVYVVVFLVVLWFTTRAKKSRKPTR